MNQLDKNIICSGIDQYAEELFRISDRIWDSPELAFTEVHSAGTLCEALKRHGFEVTTGLAGIETAFKGVYGHGEPVIGILGEFDALSGMSQVAGCAEKMELEEGGCGHGCGHNLLGTASLAAALGIKGFLEATGREGTVIYFGCPGEEGGSGKAFMARDGVFDGVDCCFAWHPGTENEVGTGSSLANIQACYRFHGVSSHAAGSPYKGRSALDAVELMNVGANYLREHIIPEARLHYAVTNSGGHSPNVIPALAEVVYLIRAPKNEDTVEIYNRVNDIARGAALMTGTTVEIDFVKACSATVPNTALEQVMEEALKMAPLPVYTEEELRFARAIYDTMSGQKEEMLMKAESMEAAEPKKAAFFTAHAGDAIHNFISPYEHSEQTWPGSTDVGDVCHVCPVGQIVAASWAAGTAPHSWQAVSQGKSGSAHKSILYAGKVMALAAALVMESPEKLKKAKKEHIKRVGEHFYSPIPKDVKPRKMG